MIENQSAENFNDSFLKSLGIHGAIVALLFIGNMVSPMMTSKNIFKLNPDVKFLKSAVRVDVVAMPTQTLQELKKVELAPAEASNEVAKVEEKVIATPAPDKAAEETAALEFKKMEKKKDFLSMLKNISKAAPLKTKDSKSNLLMSKLKGLKGKDVSGVVLLGNKISQGNSVTGGSGESDNGAFASYVSALPHKIKPFWKLPSYLMGKNLQCRVRIFIAANGELLNAEIYESSGVSDYDEKALEAIKAASPFPVPNGTFKNRLLNGEIALGFPL